MKRTITFLFAILLALSLSVGVYAQSSKVDGSVTFDGKKLTTSFSGADFNGTANALQPGDEVTYTITLKNSHTEETEWWMKNSIIKGFEESRTSARGGAYTYRLVYTAPGGADKEIYNSETVGGGGTSSSDPTDGLGLSNATSSLKDYFVLGNLKKGESAKVTLYVKLDGETQGNGYQDTLADLSMQFAVEIVPSRDVVKTGDETEILPYVIAASVSGTLLMVIAVVRIKSRKQREKRRT